MDHATTAPAAAKSRNQPTQISMPTTAEPFDPVAWEQIIDQAVAGRAHFKLSASEGAKAMCYLKARIPGTAFVQTRTKSLAFTLKPDSSNDPSRWRSLRRKLMGQGMMVWDTPTGYSKLVRLTMPGGAAASERSAPHAGERSRKRSGPLRSEAFQSLLFGSSSNNNNNTQNTGAEQPAERTAPVAAAPLTPTLQVERSAPIARAPFPSVGEIMTPDPRPREDRPARSDAAPLIEDKGLLAELVDRRKLPEAWAQKFVTEHTGEQIRKALACLDGSPTPVRNATVWLAKAVLLKWEPPVKVNVSRHGANEAQQAANAQTEAECRDRGRTIEQMQLLLFEMPADRRESLLERAIAADQVFFARQYAAMGLGLKGLVDRLRAQGKSPFMDSRVLMAIDEVLKHAEIPAGEIQ